MICACPIMVSIVVDHCDKRPNERGYKRFAKVLMYAGFSLLLLSVSAWLTGSA